MLIWFLLAGNEPEKLKKKFISFFSYHGFPQGTALWRWKNTCWICSTEIYKKDILATFSSYGIVEFSSAPSASEIEFMHGDVNALTAFQKLNSTQD
jgi:hypothetical protein